MANFVTVHVERSQIPRDELLNLFDVLKSQLLQISNENCKVSIEISVGEEG